MRLLHDSDSDVEIVLDVEQLTDDDNKVTGRYRTHHGDESDDECDAVDAHNDRVFDKTYYQMRRCVANAAAHHGVTVWEGTYPEFTTQTTDDPDHPEWPWERKIYQEATDNMPQR